MNLKSLMLDSLDINEKQSLGMESRRCAIQKANLKCPNAYSSVPFPTSNRELVNIGLRNRDFCL